jgi:hypothetical protein
MSLAGLGAVVIWHDIAPEGRQAFYAWHGREHMPERTGIPGFLRGRRYVAEGAEGPEFFNLYETVSPCTASGAEYRMRLDSPTPWTQATVRHFRNVSRSLCAVAASFGEGQGGLVATLRYAVDDAMADKHRQRLAHGILPALAAEEGIAGCHLLIADAAASAVETAERKLRAEANSIPRWVVLIEGWGDAVDFAEQSARFAASEALAAAVAPPALGIYRLQNSRSTFPWSAG